MLYITNRSFYSNIMAFHITIFLLFVLVLPIIAQKEYYQHDVNCKPHPVDVVFVFDSSQSIKKTFEHQKEVVIGMVKRMSFRPNAGLVGLIEYSRHVSTLLPLQSPQSTDEVISKFQSLKHIGAYTLTADAVKIGVEQLRYGRPGVDKVFVLITDGHSFNKWTDLVKVADSLHDTGAKVIVIAIAEDLYIPELHEYAGAQGTIFTRQNISEVENYFAALVHDKCETEAVADKHEDCAADILFVLDASGSVSDDINLEKAFIREAVSALTIRPTAHRVALIEFKLPFFAGTTFLGKALQFAEGVVKNRRPGIPLIIFVLSDGISYDDVAQSAARLRALPKTHVVSIGFTTPVNK
ncbi:Collagen alpha-6(VI) chain [Trichinella papuae]|uniref:Collagen alpha-6(VI) chain n=1 Tax=Trichinella papuae TaxID=268474 RepID=A0A0V1M5J9_9BILA|nr:Collagen alpha-6(VI) chain [Trichinella papuae]